MTNIYNKTVLVKNGTLIGNWYEEQVLREKTGEGRTIPGRHIPKKLLEQDSGKLEGYKKDETFSRTMGQRLESYMKPTSEAYGDFVIVDKKYTHGGIKDRIFENFFKDYVSNNSQDQSKLEESIQNIRLYDTTNRNMHIGQNIDLDNIGKRHMMTQDAIPIKESNVDKSFMANHEMSKLPTILSNSQVKGYVDKFTPYYKDKEITFWSMNLDKGNIYHSHSLGENAFAKTSGFTQPIQTSKSIKQFNGNITSSSTSKSIYLNNSDLEYSQKFQDALYQSNVQQDLIPDIFKKIINYCALQGWIGYRKLRIYLKNLSKRTSNVIDRSDFKYFFINFGITFNEKEIEFIFNKFDQKKNNHINSNDLLDFFVTFEEDRQELVKAFISQIKTSDSKYLSFKKIEKMFNPNIHPEVSSYRTSNEIMKEFSYSWDGLKEDDIVTEENFLKFFADVSSVIQTKEVFVECLRSCGMKF